MEHLLIAIHFGRQDLLTKCVRLAYRDLQRTVWGVARCDKAEIPHRVRALVVEAQRAEAQDGFDAWYQFACEELIGAFRGVGYHRFTVGHAQKWLNITNRCQAQGRSTLDDYHVYMDRQSSFRMHFDEPPLVTQFRPWLDYVTMKSDTSSDTDVAAG